jgi:hypothetical protein
MAPFEHCADVRGFWDDTGRRIKSYRRYRQAGQPVAIELWCEAAGMVPQLGRIAENYSIPVFSSGGFSSLSAVRMIVERARRQNVPTVLLHVGDYDPSGESIFAAMAEDAAAFLKEDRLLALQHLRAVRIALTDEQIDEFDLPTAPAKATDARSRTWKGETCQLEALAPDQLGTIVRNAIENELDLDRYRAELLLEHDDVLELWRGLPAGTSS